MNKRLSGVLIAITFGLLIFSGASHAEDTEEVLEKLARMHDLEQRHVDLIRNELRITYDPIDGRGAILPHLGVHAVTAGPVEAERIRLLELAGEYRPALVSVTGQFIFTLSSGSEPMPFITIAYVGRQGLGLTSLTVIANGDRFDLHFGRSGPSTTYGRGLVREASLLFPQLLAEPEGWLRLLRSIADGKDVMIRFRGRHGHLDYAVEEKYAEQIRHFMELADAFNVFAQ